MTLQIKTYSPTSAKIKAVVYGSSGAGKTYFGATAPKPIFASAENGLLSTKALGNKIDYVAIKTIQDLKDLYDYLAKEKHDYETVVIDSITEINDIIKNEIEVRTGKTMQLQDWGVLAKQIKSILRMFRDLDMHILFLAQEMTDKDDTGTVLKITPSLNGKSATEIAYFLDIVGYCFVDKDGSHKVVTTPSSRLITKDRTGTLGNSTNPDFADWVKKAQTMTLAKEEVKEIKTESEKLTESVDPANDPNEFKKAKNAKLI
jgi:hypothetical protein